MTKKPSAQQSNVLAEPELRATLKAALDQAEWPWIAQHLKRDAVILVAPSLELLEAGVCIAGDNAGQVQAWIAESKLSKPTAEQVAAWSADPAKRFHTLVVAPYVLMQEFFH